MKLAKERLLCSERESEVPVPSSTVLRLAEERVRCLRVGWSW